MSLQGLAAQIGRHHSEISRIERAQRGVDEALLGAILKALKVTSEERAEALTLFKDATDPNWLAPGPRRQLSVVREYEDAADRITAVQPQLIPGPLQTRAYAESVMLASGDARAKAVEGAEFRMARAAKILGSEIEYTAFIGEYALRYPPCDLSVGAEQLRHLLEVAAMPHITIRAVGIRERLMATRFGPFVLIESTRAGTVVAHLEQVAGSTTMTDSRYVRGYRDAADNLRREAMSMDATSVLIEEIADEMERTT